MTKTKLAHHYQAYRQTLVRYAMRDFPLDEDTLDALYSDLWFRMLEQTHVRTLKPNELKQYLSAGYRNLVIDHLRANARSHDILTRAQGTGTMDMLEIDLPDTRPADAEAVEAIGARVDAVMSGIPSLLQLIGTWVYVEGISHRRIARMLHVTPMQVTRYVQRFRKCFRERYQYLLQLEAEHDA